MERILEPFDFTTYKITAFEKINFGSHDPLRSHDLRNVNQPLSWKPQEIENIDLGSHDPSRSHDLGNVNWPLSR